MDVIVWGTGGMASWFARRAAGTGWRVAAYVDNDPARWGTEFGGAPVLSPEQLRGADCGAVVLCSAYASEIRAQIEEGSLTGARVLTCNAQRNDLTMADDAPFALKSWHTLQVPITETCNLTCLHCENTKKGGPVSQMPLADLVRALSHFDPEQFANLMITDGGEITLVKDLPGYVEAMGSQGFRSVSFVTNGSSGRRAVMEDVLKTGAVSEVLISIEAASEALYRRIRGQSFKRLTEFLENLRAVRERLAPKAKFFFNCTCMKENIAEVPEIVSLAARYGLHGVKFVALFPVAGKLPPEKLCVPGQTLENIDPAVVSSVFARARELGERHGLAVETPVAAPRPEDRHAGRAACHRPSDAPRSRCPMPYQWVQVGRGGEVHPCCQIAKSYSLGNVFEEDFRSVWESPAAKKLRDSLRPGAAPLPQCASCNILKGYSW